MVLILLLWWIGVYRWNKINRKYNFVPAPTINAPPHQITLTDRKTPGTIPTFSNPDLTEFAHRRGLRYNPSKYNFLDKLDAMRQESLPLNNTPSTSSSSLDSTSIIESPLVPQVPIDLTVQEIKLEFL